MYVKGMAVAIDLEIGIFARGVDPTQSLAF